MNTWYRFVSVMPSSQIESVSHFDSRHMNILLYTRENLNILMSSYPPLQLKHLSHIYLPSSICNLITLILARIPFGQWQNFVEALSGHYVSENAPLSQVNHVAGWRAQLVTILLVYENCKHWILQVHRLMIVVWHFFLKDCLGWNISTWAIALDYQIEEWVT